MIIQKFNKSHKFKENEFEFSFLNKIQKKLAFLSKPKSIMNLMIFDKKYNHFINSIIIRKETVCCPLNLRSGVEF